MTKCIRDFLRKDLVISNLEAESSCDIFKKVSELLLEKGFVEESFFKGLVNREKKFPTGLQLIKYNVAIPHTDAENIKIPTIVICTLKNPVTFNCMDGSGQVNVNIVFTMALSEPHSQLLMLQQLMELIQNENILENMMKSDNSDELYEIVSKFKYSGE